MQVGNCTEVALLIDLNDSNDVSDGVPKRYLGGKLVLGGMVNVSPVAIINSFKKDGGVHPHCVLPCEENSVKH